LNIASAASRAILCDQRTAARPKRGVELDEALANEFDAAVRECGQDVENFAIENERAEDMSRFAERVRECRVVEVAQIAPEPDERSGL
jgi:hypothetical protein